MGLSITEKGGELYHHLAKNSITTYSISIQYIKGGSFMQRSGVARADLGDFVDFFSGM
jgi:hypothetical protein